MDEIYVKTVADDGSESYQKLEDVEGFVKATEPYKKILDESVARRKTIAELKAHLEKAPAVPNEQKEEKPVEPKQEQPVLQIDALREQILQETLKALEARQSEQKQREQTIAGLMEASGLDTTDREMYEFISKSADPKAAAELLGKRLKPFQTVSRAAAPRTETEVKAFSQRVQEKMFNP